MVSFVPIKKNQKMKNLFRTMIAVLAIGSLVLSSCNKYEEGANLSLRSKNARLAGEWKAVKVEYNGVDQTSSVLPSGATFTLTIDKDGTWKAVTTFSSLSNTDTGTWEFVESKEMLKIVTTGQSDTDGDTSTIVMLKNKDLKLKSGSANDITITTYTQE